MRLMSLAERASSLSSFVVAAPSSPCFSVSDSDDSADDEAVAAPSSSVFFSSPAADASFFSSDSEASAVFSLLSSVCAFDSSSFCFAVSSSVLALDYSFFLPKKPRYGVLIILRGV